MAKRELTYEEAFERAREFSEKYVARSSYVFFPDDELVKTVQEGLARNEMEYGRRYCP